ncbi:MAG: hypothetical protein R3300_18820 [Candidatus Promineifilaceae bacterium]|nr:hypothetical protein [Candidatus Promineifilaceae bacterium]
MARILIVCTANICRSPVAEALLRRSLQEQELEAWEVNSAGTWAYTGQSAARLSQVVAAERGLEISSHQSRPVSESLLAASDLVLCMESGHKEALRTEFPEHAERIYLLSEMAGASYSVNDPYGGPRPAYERMANEIGGLIERGLSQIIQLAKENAKRRAAQGGQTDETD